MKGRPRNRLETVLALALAITVGVGPAVAGHGPDNLSDLNYQDRLWSESQLRSRGYTLKDSDWHKGSLVQYWWNGSNHKCLKVEYDDDRVSGMDGVSGTDCGQYHEEATKDNSDAAKVLAAMAIIGGIAAVAHQSHHREGQHGDDSKSVAEFERGYRDGLYHQDYHNYNDSKAYSDGYSQGVDQRHEETAYRSGHSSHSGYRAYAPVNDLVGVRASSADSELRQRGFSDTGGYKRSGRSYVTWWNAQTHQCVEVVTRDGRIDSINSIAEGNCR